MNQPTVIATRGIMPATHFATTQVARPPPRDRPSREARAGSSPSTRTMS